LSESLRAVLAAGLHWVPPLFLIGLAVFFGRTLRRGSMPLIERIARQGTPSLSLPLQRYTRALTVLWCAYFVVAAIVAALATSSPAWVGLLAWAGTVVMFVGERLLRPRFFPHEEFPGLLQQLRDTVAVWRAPR
jgi:uncharacterized membrane protein